MPHGKYQPGFFAERRVFKWKFEGSSKPDIVVVKPGLIPAFLIKIIQISFELPKFGMASL